jgi:WD40 repeat protein
MKQKSVAFMIVLGAICLSSFSTSLAQVAPDVVWEVPTPSGLANSIVGVGWAPGSVDQVAMGSTDRWLRTRRADSGALNYSILGPQHSRGGDQTIYSDDGLFLAVHNVNRGLDYRVYRVNDGFFLGTILVTIASNGLVQFAPDAQLQNSVPEDGTMKRWRLEQFTVVFTIGSGYDTTTTTFNFSTKGLYQSVASTGTIKILSRKDGSVISTFEGGASRGFTPVTFTPDRTAITAWDADSNRTTMWRVSDGKVMRQFPDAVPDEGVGTIRFTPDGMRMVTTGYLAFQNAAGSWEQLGVIRFWRVSDGALRQQFDQHTGIGVTAGLAWSPDASHFIYGTYEGTVVVAETPAP